ncbi:MAG: hypothetical protein HC836_42155 [Richelia sp. RM2_1_2]|nr:hypothetical protein [Richelia sp. RM2_1_2]
MSNANEGKNISYELERAEKVISKLEKKYHTLYKANYLSKFQCDTLFNEMMTVLVFLGDLGNTGDMNAIRIECEEKARKEFPKHPKKARTSFLRSYDNYTAPFDRLKERCWRVVDKVLTKK